MNEGLGELRVSKTLFYIKFHYVSTKSYEKMTSYYILLYGG